jgi:ABC-2 type transport system ATP-binding protein
VEYLEAERTVIQISNLEKTYKGVKRVNNVSMEVKEGEIFGLLGANGAGKSTLMSILATVLKPTAGNVLINGFDLKKEKQNIHQMIGFVPQEIALWEEFTVKDNFRFWSKFAKGKSSEEHIAQLCRAFSLQDKWNEKVANLSGGMKRKLNIAVSLIHNPSILLMDEPTVGIDLQSKLEINRTIQMMAEQGKTILYITHDIHEIIHLCDRIGVMEEGSLQFIGTLEEARQRLIQETKTPHMTVEEVVYQLLNRN